MGKEAIMNEGRECQSGALWFWWRWGGEWVDDRAGSSEGVEQDSEIVEQNKVPAMHLFGLPKDVTKV